VLPSGIDGDEQRSADAAPTDAGTASGESGRTGGHGCADPRDAPGRLESPGELMVSAPATGATLALTAGGRRLDVSTAPGGSGAAGWTLTTASGMAGCGEFPCLVCPARAVMREP
jgi:hypothetical protein